MQRRTEGTFPSANTLRELLCATWKIALVDHIQKTWSTSFEAKMRLSIWYRNGRVAGIMRGTLCLSCEA